MTIFSWINCCFSLEIYKNPPVYIIEGSTIQL